MLLIPFLKFFLRPWFFISFAHTLFRCWQMQIDYKRVERHSSSGILIEKARTGMSFFNETKPRTTDFSLDRYKYAMNLVGVQKNRWIQGCWAWPLLLKAVIKGRITRLSPLSGMLTSKACEQQYGGDNKSY